MWVYSSYDACGYTHLNEMMMHVGVLMWIVWSLLKVDEPEHKKYKSRDGSVKKVSDVHFQYYPVRTWILVCCCLL